MYPVVWKNGLLPVRRIWNASRHCRKTEGLFWPGHILQSTALTLVLLAR